MQKERKAWNAWHQTKINADKQIRHWWWSDTGNADQDSLHEKRTENWMDVPYYGFRKNLRHRIQLFRVEGLLTHFCTLCGSHWPENEEHTEETASKTWETYEGWANKYTIHISFSEQWERYLGVRKVWQKGRTFTGGEGTRVQKGIIIPPIPQVFLSFIPPSPQRNEHMVLKIVDKAGHNDLALLCMAKKSLFSGKHDVIRLWNNLI